MNKHSAQASALGYYFQAVKGLELLLGQESDSVMYIERFDDVEFEKAGTTKELIQLKHKVKKQGSLNDTSSDLWNTLKIWIEAILSGSVSVDKTTFTLMTTNKCKKDTAAYYLNHDNSIRNPSEALKILSDVAARSLSKTNESAYKQFSKLGESNQYKLLENVRIIDEIHDINETRNSILNEIKWATRKEHRKSFYENLLGWWFNLVIKHLSGESNSPLYFDELDAKIHDLSDQYTSEDLPILYKQFMPSEQEELTAQQMIFVKQLNLISLHDKRIKKAITDYYKAFNQRSYWIREKLLFLNELDEYESDLVDEWERYFLQKTQNLSSSESDKRMKEIGLEIFNWMDMDADHCIRKNCTEPYVIRGSYHMLSNELRVGWHPKFCEKLEKLLNKSGGIDIETKHNIN